MTQRRYGPKEGAGTTVTELEGSKQIIPGALGFCGYAGVFEKGPVGDVVIARTAKEFNAIMGSYYAGTQAPDCAKDFYDIAQGAGGLVLCRVTDGNEVQASDVLFNYNTDGDLFASMGVLKAKNGGKWGGAGLKYKGVLSALSGPDLTETTLDTSDADTFATDQLAGGYIELVATPNKQYPIVSNTAAGVITVSADSKMLTDVVGAELEYYIVLESAGKELSYVITDGEDSPTTEFGIEAFVDGASVRKWPNLHTDPASANYWVSAINDDELNYYFEAVDGWAGKEHTPAARPTNHYGKSGTLTSTVLTADLFSFTASGSAADGAVVLGTTTDEMVEQTLTCTFTTGAFDVVSDVFGEVLASGEASGTPVDPENKFVPPFTWTETTAPDDGDVLTIHYRPFIADALIGGFVYPDRVNYPAMKFRITDNTHDTVSVSSGYDLLAGGDIAAGEYFQIVAPTALLGGRDGIADLVDSDFVVQAWDVDASPFNQLKDEGLALIKFATPGWDAIPAITSAVDVAGKAFAEAKNHMYRCEIPSAVVDEDEAIAHINSAVGRSDFLVASFPSWGYVMDPEAPGSNKLKMVSLTGMIHGREARIAEDFGGYHKAEAGEDAILSKIKKLTTGKRELDHEKLNPAGLSMITKKKGNFVIWGDRTCYTNPSWKFKHQRELMSYYEQVLQASYDWIIFAINDPATDAVALMSLREYFRPEWLKRAIRGDSFADAAIFKMDGENNTDATRSTGDLNVEIQLRLADTVERFNILIGKQGIFDSVG